MLISRHPRCYPLSHWPSSFCHADSLPSLPLPCPQSTLTVKCFHPVEYKKVFLLKCGTIFLSLCLTRSPLLSLPLPLIGWNMPTAGSLYTLIEEDRGWCENPQCSWMHLWHSFAHHPLTKPTAMFGRPAGFCNRQVRRCRRSPVV